MPLPGFVNTGNLVEAATDLCKIIQIWQYGLALSKSVGPVSFKQQLWPGWDYVSYYTNYSNNITTDPCNYEQCLTTTDYAIEFGLYNISLPPVVNTCCSSSTCCINSQDISKFKKFLQEIVNIIKIYTGNDGASYRDSLRNIFTDSCNAIDIAIDTLNSIAGKTIYDKANYKHRCNIKNTLNNLFPVSNNLTQALLQIQNSYEQVINGSLPLPGWVVLCDCCNCETISPYFTNDLPSSNLIRSVSFCNEPYNACVDGDCETGGTGGTQSLPGSNAVAPYVSKTINVANWIPCQNSVAEGRVNSPLVCQANVTGICSEGTSSLFQGTVGCALQRQGFYSFNYDAAADITNCCPICNCDQLASIIGLNISYIGNNNFTNNCTGAGSSITTIDVTNYLATNCYVKSLSCILCS